MATPEPEASPRSKPPPGAEPAQQGSGGVAPPAAPVPTDADATQGSHFGRLARHPLTLSLGGTLVIGAFYTYEEDTTDGDGNRDTSYYRFTVVMHDLPAAATKVSDVYCQRRSAASASARRATATTRPTSMPSARRAARWRGAWPRRPRSRTRDSARRQRPDRVRKL